jgi:two-component system cell cycle sensor histidine kinase PleC
MAGRSSESTDKFIVDRRKARRETDVARAVRQTREKLSHKPGSPVFDSELLTLHAHALVASTAPIALLIVAVTAVGSSAGVGLPLAIWCIFSLACYLILAWYAQRVENTDPARFNVAAIRRNFMIGHAFTGLAWTYFAYVDCSTCGSTSSPSSRPSSCCWPWRHGHCNLVADRRPPADLRGAGGRLLRRSVGGLAPVELIMASLLPCRCRSYYVAGHQQIGADAAVVPHREGRPYRRTRNGKIDVGRSRRRAEEANLAKSRFLASMSHELRTPLNAILGFSEVMANEVLGPMSNPTYKEYAGDIHDSGKHLLDLINEILDLSRIEAGRYQLNEELISLLDTWWRNAATSWNCGRAGRTSAWSRTVRDRRCRGSSPTSAPCARSRSTCCPTP